MWDAAKLLGHGQSIDDGEEVNDARSWSTFAAKSSLIQSYVYIILVLGCFVRQPDEAE